MRKKKTIEKAYQYFSFFSSLSPFPEARLVYAAPIFRLASRSSSRAPMELGGTGGRRTRGRMQNYAQSRDIVQFSMDGSTKKTAALQQSASTVRGRRRSRAGRELDEQRPEEKTARCQQEKQEEEEEQMDHWKLASGDLGELSPRHNLLISSPTSEPLAAQFAPKQMICMRRFGLASSASSLLHSKYRSSDTGTRGRAART
jgi:hypothetical protein